MTGLKRRMKRFCAVLVKQTQALKSHSLPDLAQSCPNPNLFSAVLQTLLKQIKEMKPYSLPDPAITQPDLPLGNVAIVTHTDLETLDLYKREKRRLQRALKGGLPKKAKGSDWADWAEWSQPLVTTDGAGLKEKAKRLEALEFQIQKLQKGMTEHATAEKRRLEVLEFQSQQLEKRMQKYGTADKKQINQLNMMLNRAMKASGNWPQEKVVKVPPLPPGVHPP